MGQRTGGAYKGALKTFFVRKWTGQNISDVADSTSPTKTKQKKTKLDKPLTFLAHPYKPPCIEVWSNIIILVNN